MRITLDSAILVRANHLANGPARALLLAILDSGHSLVLSASVLEEVERVLHYPRLVKLFRLTEADIVQFVTFLAASANIVEVASIETAPIRDPNDIHILETAISGRVDYLCTLDEHFRDERVGAFCRDRGIAIISDLDLLRHIRQTSGMISPAE